MLQRRKQESSHQLAPPFSPFATLIPGAWFRFEDENGLGWAQTDFLVLEEDLVWIIEAKLSFSPELAQAQLCGLYSPLVEAVWPGRVQILVQACHNLGVGHGGISPKRILQLGEVFDKEPGPDGIYVWHRL